VDLVTEEVEPGVHRVMSDGLRDLSRTADDEGRYLGGILDGNIVAGLYGSVWWFGREGFFRIGDEGMNRWPARLVERIAPGQVDLEVGPDGTIWLPSRPPERLDSDTTISSYDGASWTTHRLAGEGDLTWSFGVEVQADGSVWTAWLKEFDRDRDGYLRKANRDKVTQGRGRKTAGNGGSLGQLDHRERTDRRRDLGLHDADARGQHHHRRSHRTVDRPWGGAFAHREHHLRQRHEPGVGSQRRAA
jgi:hypothetical protein